MLKGQHLYYYKEEEELKPQVTLGKRRKILDVDAYLCCWGDGRDGKAEGGKGFGITEMHRNAPSAFCRGGQSSSQEPGNVQRDLESQPPTSVLVLFSSV